MFANEAGVPYQDELVKEHVAVMPYQDESVKEHVAFITVDDPLKKVNFQDFLAKTEILRAIVDCGFENPTAGNYIKYLQVACYYFIFRFCLFG